MSSPRVGYRFVPSDEEIISHFLKHKMAGNDSVVNDDVHEIDLYKHEPWDLPSLCANEESHDQTWYFFCKREKNKSHQRRLTKVGYWKSTGQDRRIKNKAGKEIGTKKTLRFHIGRTPRGKPTEWTIHEYNSSSVLPHQPHFVLCKLMKKNEGKADALCPEKTLGNPPSNNGNGRTEILMEKVDQERSLSRNLGDSFHPPEMQPPVLTEEEILSYICDEFDDSYNNGYLNEYTGLRSSSDFSENERRLADSFFNFPDECSPSTVIFQGEGPSNVQDGHAIARTKEYQQRRSLALTGTLPPLNHDDNGREKTVVHRGEASEEDNIFAVVTEDYEIGVAKGSFLNTITLGYYENGQEFSESSSSSSTTPQQDIQFTGHEWLGSSGNHTKKISANRNRFQSKPSNESAKKIQKPVAVHLSQNKNSDDSGKTKNVLTKPEKDQIMAVAAASSKLRTFISSFIRFETLPTDHRQDPPFVYIANVLVGLVLFVVISREMLIFH